MKVNIVCVFDSAITTQDMATFIRCFEKDIVI